MSAEPSWRKVLVYDAVVRDGGVVRWYEEAVLPMSEWPIPAAGQ